MIPSSFSDRKLSSQLVILCLAFLLAIGIGVTESSQARALPAGSVALQATSPLDTPTTEPTSTPTLEPTFTPTSEPTSTPTLEPTSTPTATSTPTLEPTSTPTSTSTPTLEPTPLPGSASCNPTNGSGGLPIGTYHTTVAGLNAIVVVGEGYDPQAPTYLGFNIHGDGGMYRMIERLTNPLNRLANERGWILVSPQAPNGSSWWTNFQGDHNQAMANVLDEMFARYNLCRNIVFGTTGSGGSEFWTSQFFPNKGGQYPAHTVIACGGSPGSRSLINPLGQNPDVVARSTFYYVYGTEDNLVPLILRSIEAYTGAGFRVRVEEIQGAGHCNRWRQEGLPTWHERAAGHWAELAAELGIN